MSEYRWRPSNKQMGLLHATAQEGEMTHDDLKVYARNSWGIESLRNLDQHMYDSLLTVAKIARSIEREKRYV